jgi:eukaryotic-like serine/threonine-protein kinase
VGTVSPDGNMVAFTEGAIGSATVSVWNMARDVVTAVSSNRMDVARPVWTPDGRHLVFSSRQGNRSILWWTRADGGSEPLKLAESEQPLEPYSFSPDGKRLAYSAFAPDTAYDVWTMPLDISDPDKPKPGKPEPFLQQPVGESNPAFSPDGRWIAFVSTAMGSPQVEVRPFPGPGGHWQASSGGSGAVSPLWVRNARQLLYSTLEGQIMVVDYEIHGDSFVPGKPRPWAETRISANLGRPEFELTPDGQRVLTRVIPNDSLERNISVHVTLLFNFFDELKRKLP